MDKFVTRNFSSARSSIAASCFFLSLRNTLNSCCSTSARSIFSQKHQDCLPDHLLGTEWMYSSFKPILPKNFSPPLQKILPPSAFSSGFGPDVRAEKERRKTNFSTLSTLLDLRRFDCANKSQKNCHLSLHHGLCHYLSTNLGHCRLPCLVH